MEYPSIQWDIIHKNEWGVWRREWLPTPIFSPGEFHGQRSLEGYSPWDHKELDMTEWLHFHFQYTTLKYCVRKCFLFCVLNLESVFKQMFLCAGHVLGPSANPMDGGAWDATVQEVEKSRTRLSDFTFTFFHSFRKLQWSEVPCVEGSHPLPY